MQAEAKPTVVPEINYDAPDRVSADLRKFNRVKAKVAEVLAPLKLILHIQDQQGDDSAMDHMKTAKEVEKIVEAKRVFLVKPYNTEATRINSHAKELIKEVPTEIQRVKDLVAVYREGEKKKALAVRKENRIVQISALGLEYDGQHYKAGNFLITENEIELYDDQPWISVIEKITTELAILKEEKVKALNEQLQGAAFFGDDQETDEIRGQLEAVKSAPVPTAHVASFGGYSGSFSKGRGSTKTWTFELEDLSLVPREYLVLDEKKVREAVAAGVRTIAGVKIFQKDSISLR